MSQREWEGVVALCNDKEGRNGGGFGGKMMSSVLQMSCSWRCLKCEIGFLHRDWGRKGKLENHQHRDKLVSKLIKSTVEVTRLTSKVVEEKRTQDRILRDAHDYRS